IRRAKAADLPFDLAFTKFFANCRPMPVPLQSDGSERGIDGYELRALPLDKAAEADVAGLEIALLEKDGRAALAPRALLFGLQREPWRTEIDGRAFEIDLRKARHELPFEIALLDFTRELHPGTGMPSQFYSDVSVLQEGSERELTIRMNEPLRQDGFTLYQASWGPSTAGPNDRLFSTFAVVRNPADRWPLYACIVIGLGLLMHFLPRLTKHVRAQEKRWSA
ncbi:MAG: cytochrome c biogenesis protein ResB, partial [Planctomycetota bacterium]